MEARIAESCNLSPRGDGNIKILPVLQTFLKLQLIPARGRKRLLFGHIARVNEVATYPREGTETDIKNLYPTISCVATYPREGTETM